MVVERPPCGKCSSSSALTVGAGAMQHMQAAVRVLIEGVGEDSGREGLLDTPRVRRCTEGMR